MERVKFMGVVLKYIRGILVVFSLVVTFRRGEVLRLSDSNNQLVYFSDRSISFVPVVLQNYSSPPSRASH